MNSSVSPPQNEGNDRCPDCLRMKIEGEPILHRSLNPLAQRSYSKIDLYLTVLFNQQWFKLFAGRVRLGINGGELRLTLENGRIPIDSRELCGELNLDISVKRTEKAVHKDKAGIKVTSKGGELVDEDERTSERTDEVQFVTCQVTTKGSDTEPAWVFEEKQGEPVLKGVLKKTKFATMHVTAKPCFVRARFEISPQNVRFTEAEGIWSSDHSSAKRITVDRLLARKLLSENIQPYLSIQELSYE